MGRAVIETLDEPAVIDCLEREGVAFERFGDLLHITTDTPDALVQRLVAACNPSRLSVRNATLEDVFLRLTGRGLKD
ncbi:MAG TPA: hypothetical protein HA263_05505 [Methanoregulaceae archaeon]|nr:hypothetical protein [Methanoregulaceae archaeon]